MSLLRPTPRAVRPLLVLAMLAFVLAQALGGWHRILHGINTASHAGATAPAARDAGHAPHAHGHTHSHVHGHAHGHEPYAHEAGSATCQLLDALTQAGVPPASPCALPPSTAATVTAQRARSVVVAAATPFDARGPPAAH